MAVKEGAEIEEEDEYDDDKEEEVLEDDASSEAASPLPLAKASSSVGIMCGIFEGSFRLARM